MTFGRCADSSRGKFDQVSHELVWVLCPDSELAKVCGREIVKVEGDDHGSRSTDRRRKYVTIIGIGQREPFDQIFVSGNQTIPDMSVHERPSTLQLFPLQIWPILEHTPDPFVVDLVRPAGTKQIRQRQMHE